MIGTFDALAKFGSETEGESAEMKTQENASVDISAVINRLNEIETTVTKLSKMVETANRETQTEDTQTETKTEDAQTETQIDEKKE